MVLLCEKWSSKRNTIRAIKKQLISSAFYAQEWASAVFLSKVVWAECMLINASSGSKTEAMLGSCARLKLASSKNNALQCAPYNQKTYLIIKENRCKICWTKQTSGKQLKQPLKSKTFALDWAFAIFLSVNGRRSKNRFKNCNLYACLLHENSAESKAARW